MMSENRDRPTTEIASIDYSDLGDLIHQPPAGWYAFERERHAPFLSARIGSTAVIWRAANNELTAASAFCPHMGADLACGHWDSDRVICPFHHKEIKLTRADDRRTDIPPLRLFDDELLMFHRPAGWNGPIWEPSDRSLPSRPTAQRSFVTESVVSPLLVFEGVFDVGHFQTVHGQTPKVVSTSFDGTSARAEINLSVPGHKARSIVFELDGLGRLTQTIQHGRYTLDRQADFALVGSQWKMRVRQACWGPSKRGADRVLQTLEAAALADLEHDLALWRHRRFTNPSVYGRGDRALIAYRSWARQFVAVGHDATQT